MDSTQNQAFKWGASTDMGRVRLRNEDAFAVDVESGVIVVSDGIGGGEGGGAASAIVVKMLPQMFANRARVSSTQSEEAIRSILRSAVSDLSDQLHARTNGSSGFRGMGATVVAIVIRDALVHVAHMGDSRAYLLRAGRMKRLTDDHSVVGILERRQEISSQEARHHAARGQLTRFVGMPIPALPDISSLVVQKGDRALLCTDGLTVIVDDETILTVLREVLNPQEASKHLVEAAITAGGPDNITAVVVDW